MNNERQNSLLNLQAIGDNHAKNLETLAKQVETNYDQTSKDIKSFSGGMNRFTPLISAYVSSVDEYLHHNIENEKFETIIKRNNADDIKNRIKPIYPF